MYGKIPLAARVADQAEGIDSSMTEGKLTLRQYLCLFSLVALLLILCYGCVRWKWGNNNISVIFIYLGIITGFCGGFGPSQIARYFVDGAKNYVTTAFVIGIAKGITVAFNTSGCMDTIVYGLSAMLNIMPNFLKGAAMYWANTIINLPITSGSGQAAAVMPLFIPIGDIIGLTRQTTVLAYNFGDGFCNYILPWSSALMGNLAVANIPYDRWMKFFWKFFLVWFALATVLVIIAQAIRIGPF